MKRILFVFSLIAVQMTSFAQLGVGTNTPDASAQLDVTATDKGFLAPRIALTGATDVATITSPATGLMIYNTATAGTAPNNVLPGYYYFDGVKWVRLIIGTNASKWTNDPINSKSFLTNLSDGTTLRAGDTNFVVTDNNILQIGNITNVSGANNNDKAIVACKAGNNSISLTSDGGIYSAFGGQIYGGTSSGSAAYFTMTKYRGSAASPAVVQNGDLIGILDFRGGTGVGSGFVNGARLITAVDGAVNTSLSPASIPMSYDFQTVAPGQTAPNSRLKISSNGNVGIDNSSPFINLSVGSSNLSHKMGRAIINANGVHAADKRDAFHIGRWDGTSGYNEFLGIKFNVSDGASIGEGNDNHAFLTFHTWGNNISGSVERMRLDQRGRLGIGLSPSHTLDVLSGSDWATRISSTNINGTGILINPQGVGGIQSGIYSTANTNGNGGGKFLLIHNNISAIAINNLGNIGIGTTSPTSKLDVNGAALIRNGNSSSSNTNNQLLFGYSSSNTYQHAIKTRHNNASAINNAIDFYLWSNTDAVSAVGSKHVMTLEATGNVGIGTVTPNGGLTLYGPSSLALPTNIQGTGGATKELVFGRGGLTTGFAAITGVDNGYYGGGLSFIVKPSGTDNFPTNAIQAMILDWNGNMGLGTGSPTQRLDVNGRVRIRTIDTGVASDSILVVNGGVIKKVTKSAGVNIQTSNYTLTASDNGNIVIMNSATDVTLTVPATLPAGFVVQIIQKGAGQVSVVGSGATINSANGLKTRVTNSAIGVVMETSTLGYVTGDSNF